jgi:hypothetical protein
VINMSAKIAQYAFLGNSNCHTVERVAALPMTSGGRATSISYFDAVTT